MPASEPQDKRLRVVLLSSGLGYTLRGIEIWMLELARHLPDELAVELWSGGKLDPEKGRNDLCLHGISRDSRWLRGFSWGRRYEWEQLSMLPMALFHLFWRRRDVVYCGDPVLSWHLKRFRRWHKARIIFMNGTRLSANWAQSFDGVHLLAPPYLNAARADLPGTRLDHFFAIPHFVDVERFHPPTPQERLDARLRHGLNPDDFVILNVGPIGTASRKRLDHLIREMGKLTGRGVLVNAGDTEEGSGEVLSVARELGPERVRFLGKIDREQMPSLYQIADIYSLAALDEPFSIAILEALSSGLPVLHHGNEVTQWVTGSGGVTVDMTQPGHASASIAFLRDHPEELHSVGQAARDLAMQRYHPRQVCLDLCQAIQRIAGSPSPTC